MEMNANLGKKLLSIGEASKYLGVSIDTLRRWEKKGRIIPFRSPGEHRYYSKDELDLLFGKRYTRESTKPYVIKPQEETQNVPNTLLNQNTMNVNKEEQIISSDLQPKEYNPVEESNLSPQQTESVLLPDDKILLKPQPETIINKVPSIQNIQTANHPTESVSNNGFGTNTPSTLEHLQDKKDIQEEPSLIIPPKPQNTEEMLRNLNINYTQKENSKTQIILIITIIIITILDVALFILWYSSSTKIVVPIP
jgi:excisionase family DNA binding protein